MHQTTISGKTDNLACVIRGQTWPVGFSMHTDASAFVQVATWQYQSGKTLQAHAHRSAPRVSAHTQEVVYVVRGSLKADIFDVDDTLVETVLLHGGDCLIVYCGGHGYSIVEDGTRVLEVKNGPYPGLELDKRVIGRAD